MITYTQAQKILTDAVKKMPPLTEQTLPLEDCIGYTLSKDIQAPVTIQPFDNSAMDGFAVRRQDLLEASENTPMTLTQTATIAAGQTAKPQGLKPQTCQAIMTGALLPVGADAVVPVEQVSVRDNQITFTQVPKRQANIRFAGEDFKKGDTVLSAGTQLTHEHILPLATLGISHVNVWQKPTAIVFTTGDELINDLTKPLENSQIYNGNMYYMRAALQKMGVDCLAVHHVKDDGEAFGRLLQEQLQKHKPHMVISSGAVSAGLFDFVGESVQAQQADILYHKVRIKPGKPNLLAQFADKTLFFGLPGNPVATAVGLRFFVSAAVRSLLQLPPEKPLKRQLVNTFTKKAGVQMFLKAQAQAHDDKFCHVAILDGQESFKVHPFARLTGWVVAPENSEQLERGDEVDYYPSLSKT